MNNKPIPAIQKMRKQFPKPIVANMIISRDEMLDIFEKILESELLNEQERIDRNIGMLRQWLNEDRIKDADNFVTNEELEHWLELKPQLNDNDVAELKEGGE